MSDNNYRCQQCTDECVGMCAKDWHPDDEDYKPENAIVWFVWFALGFIAILILRWALS